MPRVLLAQVAEFWMPSALSNLVCDPFGHPHLIAAKDVALGGVLRPCITRQERGVQRACSLAAGGTPMLRLIHTSTAPASSAPKFQINLILILHEGVGAGGNKASTLAARMHAGAGEAGAGNAKYGWPLKGCLSMLDF